jgi:hypothetical protein
MNERGELERILAQNGEKAREVAERNMAKIKAVIGF